MKPEPRGKTKADSQPSLVYLQQRNALFLVSRKKKTCGHNEKTKAKLLEF